MPITKYIKEQSFDPEEIEVIIKAFKDVCEELGLVDRNDPAVELIAQRVITAAGYGATDAADLMQRVLKDHMG